MYLSLGGGTELRTGKYGTRPNCPYAPDTVLEDHWYDQVPQVTLKDYFQLDICAMHLLFSRQFERQGATGGYWYLAKE
jgi:hypothetical protein